jgi:hypothetical protein
LGFGSWQNVPVYSWFYGRYAFNAAHRALGSIIFGYGSPGIPGGEVLANKNSDILSLLNAIIGR